MISDAHSGIYLSLAHTSPEAEHPNHITEESIIIKPFWSPEAGDVFLQHLNTHDINQFIKSLDSLSSNNFTKENIESYVPQCSSLLFNAADAAGMIKHSIVKIYITVQADTS